MKQLVAGSVMEGASMMFHGDNKKRSLLTIMVSQILLLIKLISEIKNTPRQKDFSLHCHIFKRFLQIVIGKDHFEIYNRKMAQSNKVWREGLRKILWTS